MGRFEGESCGSYLLYIMSSSDILFIVFFFFIGLRTEFKRKATCSVVEPELHDV